jgi:hypothetical protein
VRTRMGEPLWFLRGRHGISLIGQDCGLQQTPAGVLAELFFLQNSTWQYWELALRATALPANTKSQ